MGARVPSTSQSTAADPAAARRGAISSEILASTAGSAVTEARRRARSSRLVSRPVSRDRLAKLVAIGTAAGAFSGLFGVGGGTVIVPLLILWLGYGEREATGTSLAAIVVIAALAAAGQGLYGNVDIGDALVVGAPALLGVVAGAALQQRLPERAVAFMFAALLVATAVALILP
jgi:uncharacterized membrane protein YfcA